MTDASTVVAAPATPAVPLHTKFEQLENTLNGLVFEREAEISTALNALVAKKHHLQVGPPGIAKTFLVDQLVMLVDGVKDTYFRWLMTRFTTPPEIFGPPSLKALENDEYRVNTAHKLAEARLAFLDEFLKANSSILNALLTILNEGLFFNNGHPVEVPLGTLFAASNELPREPELAALWDRITFRHEVKPLYDADNLKRMFQTRMAARLQTTPLDPIISWDDVTQAQAEARQVTVPDDVLDKLIQLRSVLRGEGVEPTERRFNDCIPIIQARAWLDGYTVADADHLKDLRHVLWVDLKDRPAVDKAVLEIANPLDKEALDLLQTVEKLASEADDVLRSTEGRTKQQNRGVEIYGKLERASKDLDKLAAQAQQSSKKSDMIGKAQTRLAKVAQKMLEELFGYTEDDGSI